MQLLLAFLLIAVISGFVSRTLDWRGYATLLFGALLVTGVYMAVSGAW
jgi:hypothetical protein